MITSPSFPPVIVFPQFIPYDDINGIAAPGMPNIWDISTNFNLDDGYNDQFDGALQMKVGTTNFPWDQNYGELTLYTPVMGAADGIITAAVSNDTNTNYQPINGYSAYLYPTGNSILQQTINLGSASGPVTLNCWLHGNAWNGNYPGAPNKFRIVIRNTTGTELATIYSLTNSDVNSAYNADLSAYSGQTIVLSFEHTGHRNPMVIDNVSVQDGTATEFVANGDFETGTLSSWTANTVNMMTNITSGTRTLEGLDVTRSFYTVPNMLWGRWVDVFFNPTGADITKTITYYINLGSDNYGITYYTPATSNKALTSWDGRGYDRDIGYVFGNASTVTFASATALNTYATNANDIFVTHNITVPAGGSVAIVSFLIMSGTDTGRTATDINARATKVDNAAAAIVSNFWIDRQYRRGMTQEQIDAIVNF